MIYVRPGGAGSIGASRR